jgi:hypothetical protein
MKRITTYLFIAALLFTASAKAQEGNETPLDTLTRSVQAIRSELDVLKRIKLSGYVQSQFQWADSSGIKSFAGGDFPSNTDKRFKVRRAEFKTMYDNGITQIAANIDITQNGVNIKDAFGKFTEQRLKVFSLTAGIFNRPFGFEVPYSSGLLESPERARVIQVLFPGERDCGAMIGFRPGPANIWHNLRIEGGMFNGTGNNVNDFDFQKDFIGNIHWIQTSKNEKSTFGIGASYYSGGWANGTTNVYRAVKTNANGDKAYVFDSVATNKNHISGRTYTGVDAQYSIDGPIGMTVIRGEYIMGTQPGTSSTSVSPSAQPATDTYIRHFDGAYFYFVQNIMKTPWQVIVKYDWYDPNTDLNGNDIGKAKTFTGAQDLKYTTLGLGLAFRASANVKFTAYYDLATNETTNAPKLDASGNVVKDAKGNVVYGLPGYQKDLKDNVFTLRCQFKF